MSQIMSFFSPFEKNCHEVHELHHYLTIDPWNYFEGANVSIQLILPIAAFLAVCYFVWNLISEKRLFGKCFSNNIRIIATIVLIAGFILYFIGYSHQIRGINGWMILGSTIQAGGRALLSSLGMFVFDTDFIEIEENYHHNIWYLIAFSIIHILGILVTTHVILRLLGERFLSNKRMSRILRKKAKRDIFVFWGINEESITLARSIKNKFDEDIKKFELIFVETPSEKEQGIKELSFSQFITSSLHGSSEKDRIEELGGTILFPKRRLIDVDKEMTNRINEKEESKESDNHFKKLGLKSLTELCNKSENVHFFFLSDDEQKNIQDTLIIQELFKEKATNQKLHLYCKSRDNYANRAIINAKGFFITKLIDDAALSITTLKELNNNGKYPAHPINYVNPDRKRGIVQNPFTALIIGFGTAGQDALRFLYEYGTFIKSPGEESPFKCYIIDKEMNNIKGQFIREVPAFECDKQPDSMKNIEFLHLDWNSETLMKMFTNIIFNELNYVVIATGNDQSNMTIAAELYEYVLKNRKDSFRNFHIFVRAYAKENEKMMGEISSFYKKNDPYGDVITVFGKMSDKYTYQNIIKDEDKERKAREFFETYLKVSDESNETEEKKEKKRKLAWDCRNRKIKNVTSYGERLKLIHQRGQDYSNVLHMYTKLTLCDYTCNELPSWKDFNFDIKSYEENEKEKMICYRNLAELEHLRWNAAHYMAGFVYAEEKDFRKKTHPCLKPFKDLDDSIKRYDYATVIATIELDKKKGKKEVHP